VAQTAGQLICRTCKALDHGMGLSAIACWKGHLLIQVDALDERTRLPGSRSNKSTTGVSSDSRCHPHNFFSDEGIPQFRSNQSLRSELIMKARAWLFAAAISVSSLALAQTAPTSSVTESTDPAKIAEIERHAQELASAPPTTPVMGERDGSKRHGMRHQKNRATHKRATKDKAPSDTPMATDSKG
jgi:hypothetical protein